MWESKSKYDLIIEVWEKLDCESIGQSEIEAIEMVVNAEYGTSPTDTPMRLARLLADEGAELRHSELLELDVRRRTSSADLPVLSRPLDISDVESALRSIDELEIMRRRFSEAGNTDGVRGLRNKAMKARDDCAQLSNNSNKSVSAQRTAAEISECLSIWIQSPEIYEAWKKAKYPEHGRIPNQTNE